MQDTGLSWVVVFSDGGAWLTYKHDFIVFKTLDDAKEFCEKFERIKRKEQTFSFIPKRVWIGAGGIRIYGVDETYSFEEESTCQCQSEL